MKTKKPNLTKEEKTLIAQILLEHISDGTLTKGKISEAALVFGLSRRTVGKIWAAAKSLLSEGKPVIFNETKYANHKDMYVLDIELLKSIPLQKRTSYRRIARERGVSKSLVCILVKNGLIRPHSPLSAK
ncbi:hypothetical protein ACS0TY_003950 [Phlomoides rotata]